MFQIVGHTKIRCTKPPVEDGDAGDAGASYGAGPSYGGGGSVQPAAPDTNEFDKYADLFTNYSGGGGVDASASAPVAAGAWATQGDDAPAPAATGGWSHSGGDNW